MNFQDLRPYIQKMDTTMLCVSLYPTLDFLYFYVIKVTKKHTLGSCALCFQRSSDIRAVMKSKLQGTKGTKEQCHKIAKILSGQSVDFDSSVPKTIFPLNF